MYICRDAIPPTLFSVSMTSFETETKKVVRYFKRETIRLQIAKRHINKQL